MDEDGTEWTEVTIVLFIFESAANGVSTHQIVRILNDKGIPTPYLTRAKRVNGMTEEPIWQPYTIRRLLKNTGYYGEYRQFQIKRIFSGNGVGQKKSIRQVNPEHEQVIIPIPAIVTKDLFEKANRRVEQNKALATRNNQTSKESLMRGGFAKCAYCSHSLRITRNYQTRPSTGNEVVYFFYDCDKCYLKKGKCHGCAIPVDMLDSGVTEYILETIRDPSEVDEKIRKLQEANPAHKQEQKKLKNLNTILHDQETYRVNFAKEMRKKTMSEKTVAFLTAQLEMLEQQEEEARRDLADQQRMQEKEEKLRVRIAEFHKQCQLWREN